MPEHYFKKNSNFFCLEQNKNSPSPHFTDEKSNFVKNLYAMKKKVEFYISWLFENKSTVVELLPSIDMELCKNLITIFRKNFITPK